MATAAPPWEPGEHVRIYPCGRHARLVRRRQLVDAVPIADECLDCTVVRRPVDWQ